MTYTKKLIEFASQVQSEISVVYPEFSVNVLECLVECGNANQLTEEQVIDKFDWYLQALQLDPRN
jgi:hypothetical protein